MAATAGHRLTLDPMGKCSNAFFSETTNMIKAKLYHLLEDLPIIIPGQFGFNCPSGFREEDLNVIFYQNMPNLHNRYKSAERKISQKNPEECAQI
jgi:hypothetical protein